MHDRLELKIGVLTLLSIFLLIFGCQKDAQSVPKAPDFTLSDLSGQMTSLQQYRGKVVLLDFWATWCPPCRIAIPELIKLQEEYREKGLVILGISMDDPKDVPIDYLRIFQQEHKINYKILRLDDKVVQDYFGYDSPAIPTLFVIDREGKIREKIVGFQPGAVKKSLSKLIK
jgi:peroxiredoxin